FFEPHVWTSRPRGRLAVGQVDDADAIAFPGEPGQGSATSNFHIVGVGAHGDQVQLDLSSLTHARPESASPQKLNESFMSQYTTGLRYHTTGPRARRWGCPNNREVAWTSMQIATTRASRRGGRVSSFRPRTRCPNRSANACSTTLSHA